MAHRYFTNNIQQNRIFIDGPDAVHIGKVLRAKPGEQLSLCDGCGTDYLAKILEITPGCIECEIISSEPSKAEPTVKITVYVGYGKGDKIEWVIQKAVELGAVRIVPFFSKYCVVKPKKEEEKNQRYKRIALEAAKQSGRGVVPEVETAVSYKEMLALTKQQQKSFLLYEGGGTSLAKELEKITTIALISGPEGGFSPEEIEAAKAAGVVIVGLGPRILRCETAPIAAITAAMVLTGNMEG